MEVTKKLHSAVLVPGLELDLPLTLNVPVYPVFHVSKVKQVKDSPL